MRIAIAQTEIIYEQYQKNKTIADSLIGMAQAMDARLLLFPEMSFTGFTMHIDYSIPVGLDTVPWIQQAAADHHLYIGFGLGSVLLQVEKQKITIALLLQTAILYWMLLNCIPSPMQRKTSILKKEIFSPLVRLMTSESVALSAMTCGSQRFFPLSPKKQTVFCYQQTGRNEDVCTGAAC